jgi:hypothetical protein
MLASLAQAVGSFRGCGALIAAGGARMNGMTKRSPERRGREAVRNAQMPWWQAEIPFALLFASALATPLVVLDQGGDLRFAILSGLVVLSVPGAAIESILGVVRAALYLRGE